MCMPNFPGMLFLRNKSFYKQNITTGKLFALFGVFLDMNIIVYHNPINLNC